MTEGATVEIPLTPPTSEPDPLQPGGKGEGDERGRGWWGAWNTRYDHLATMISLMVGMSLVSNIPYYFMRYSVVFLLPFLIVMTAMGVPLVLLFSFMGQFTSASIVRSSGGPYRFLGGVGVAMCFAHLQMVPYLSTWMSYAFVYLSYSNSLPWATCDNFWNTETCVTHYNYNSSEFSSASEFFWNRVLSISPDITEPGQVQLITALAVILVWFLITVVVMFNTRGIAVVMWLTATLPLALLVLLFFRAVTLPGAGYGIRFIFYLSIYRLTDPSIWWAATHSVWHTMGFGLGVYTTVASYNPFRYNLARDVIIGSSVYVVVSLIVTIIVACMTGFVSAQADVDIFEVMSAGTDLLYSMIPMVCAELPGGSFWAGVWFLMLGLAEFDLLMWQVQVVVESVCDGWERCRRWRWVVVLVICLVNFLSAIGYCAQSGFYSFILMDSTSVITLHLLLILLVTVFAFIYGAGRITRDIELISNIHVSYYCYWTWIASVPYILVMSFIYRCTLWYAVYMKDYMFPEMAVVAGYVLWCVPLLAGIIYGIVRLLLPMSGKKQPGKDVWRPWREVDEAAWLSFSSQHPLRNRYAHRTF